VLELDIRPSDKLSESPPVELRPLEASDWAAVADIYWDGMRDGLATFETEVPTWEAWHDAHHAAHRFVAVANGEVVGWAALSPTSPRRCYAGVAEDSVYVARHARGRGVGRRLLGALVESADRAGIWTIQTSLFPENRASLGLHESCGFRVVGFRERIAKRDGIWRDTLLLERRSDAA
jgi:L-amino acid N-acyltransferase YncA